MMKRKIVHLTAYFAPHTGGTEKYVKDVAIGLAERGHDVTVISCNVPESAHAPADEVIEGVKIKRLPAKDFLYLPVTRAFNLGLLDGADVVHIHCPPFGFLRSVGGRIKCPVVVTYHCDTTVSERMFGMRVPKFIPWLVEGGTDRYARKLLKKASAIISTSHSYASTSRVLKDFKCDIIPIGINYERFDTILKKIGLSEESRRQDQVVFVGRLAANKGVHYLVEAMPRIIKEVPSAHFIIAGEGEEKPAIVKQIAGLGLESHVTFYGKVTAEILVQLYATSSVFVLPSINRLEAFGIVQLEAMACSTPVVASDLPGVNSVMDQGKSGYIAPIGDSNGLAEALLKILRNKEHAREMGRAARALIEKKYDWKIIFGQIEALYERVIAEHK